MQVCAISLLMLFKYMRLRQIINTPLFFKYNGQISRITISKSQDFRTMFHLFRIVYVYNVEMQ
jgi:hypothetical protein